jgi:hypothetical protein
MRISICRRLPTGLAAMNCRQGDLSRHGKRAQYLKQKRRAGDFAVISVGAARSAARRL